MTEIVNTSSDDCKLLKGARDSGIELFRIIAMLTIVASHYVSGSGIKPVLMEQSSLTLNNVFLMLFGWGGKAGINGFMLITGYFMCKSQITVRKYLKLLLWVEFYHIVLYAVFLATGRVDFGVMSMIKAILPVTSISNGFTPAFLVFYLFIPFINILIKGMDKKQHLCLMILCVCVYTGLATLQFKVTFNYVTWFTVIYIIGSYIRLYPEKWFDSRRIWGIFALVSLLLAWASIIVRAYLSVNTKGNIGQIYFYVNDANMPLALIPAVCAFMFFKNLNIGYSKFINTVAASTFGVLLIHSGSDAMRNWLWQDTLNNLKYMDTNMVFVHAFVSVAGVFIVCTAIDLIRFNLLEKPFFKWYDKKFTK